MDTPHNILLIEDDAKSAESVRSILSAHHFVVDVVGSMGDLKDHLSSGVRACSVTILDLGLPDSSDFDTIRRVRSLLPASVPIVVMTGADLGVFARVEGARMGVASWLSKPARANCLVESVRTSVELATYFATPHQAMLSAFAELRDEVSELRERVVNPRPSLLARWGEWFRGVVTASTMQKLIPLLTLTLGLAGGDCGRSCRHVLPDGPAAPQAPAATQGVRGGGVE